jgi:L-fucose isomerase-like protein
VILGNRDFFPDALIAEACRDLVKLFAETGVNPIWLRETNSKLGALETWADAIKCGELFNANRQSLEGILVCLPNFGDEKGVADAIRLSELSVPILMQACPDDLDQFGLSRRRDANCGKISVCNNLRQYGFKFTLTRDQTVKIVSDQFRADFENFFAVCRIVRGMPPRAHRSGWRSSKRFQYDSL